MHEFIVIVTSNGRFLYLWKEEKCFYHCTEMCLPVTLLSLYPCHVSIMVSALQCLNYTSYFPPSPSPFSRQFAMPFGFRSLESHNPVFLIQLPSDSNSYSLVANFLCLLYITFLITKLTLMPDVLKFPFMVVLLRKLHSIG